MSWKYLNNKKWADVTREERLFCSHLYHKINSPQNAKEFIQWLNSTESPIKGFKNQNCLNKNADWEASFETCFYRDVLKSYGYGVKERFEELKSIESIGEGVTNLIKRTFDLALFSSETIVIIEAKAAGGIDSKQFKDFEMDENLIKGIFRFLNIKPPKIVFYILAANKYYLSKAFTSPKGIGKINIIDKQNNNECKISGLISWKQLLDSDQFSDSIFLRAEEVYNN
jgi:hypothetical protein